MSSPSSRVHQNAAEKVKQLYQIMEISGTCTDAEWIPFFCVEARIDFNDIRTGFRETVSLTKALEIYSDNADLLWTDDMIREVDLLKTSSAMPDDVRLGVLPGFVDANFLTRMENQFVQYLLRSFEARVYRNFDLNLYSFSGESRTEFCKRCVELFDARKRSELDKLHDVFNRKMEQAKQKYLGDAESAELELAKSESRNRDVFSRCSEQVAELFNSAESGLPAPVGPKAGQSEMQELEERLLALQVEVHQAITAISNSFDEKARAIDEYILHPNLKDIHFVRSCILWMPKETA